MAIIAKAGSENKIKPLEAGTYLAVCSGLIDLGIQYNEKFDKKIHKVLIIWDIVDEFIEVDGKKQPRKLSKEYGLSLHKKAALRKDLEAWRNKTFTEQEL